MKLFKLLKTAKWWRSRHIDSWAREAKFYWKLSTHYLDLANLSQQDFNFCKLSRFPRDRQDKIKHQIWTSGFLCEYGNWMICHDAWWLFITLALLVLLSELNWFKVIQNVIPIPIIIGIPFPAKGVGFYICKLAESKVMTNLHSDTQKVHPRILQKTQTFEFPLWKIPSRKVQNFSF